MVCIKNIKNCVKVGNILQKNVVESRNTYTIAIYFSRNITIDSKRGPKHLTSFQKCLQPLTSKLSEKC